MVPLLSCSLSLSVCGPLGNPLPPYTRPDGAAASRSSRGNPGMLPPSSTGLRRSRSDAGARRSERKALLGSDAGGGALSERTPRKLFIDQQHRDQHGSNQDENSAGEGQLGGDYHSDDDHSDSDGGSMSECAPPPRANYTPRRTVGVGF